MYFDQSSHLEEIKIELQKKNFEVEKKKWPRATQPATQLTRLMSFLLENFLTWHFRYSSLFTSLFLDPSPFYPFQNSPLAYIKCPLSLSFHIESKGGIFRKIERGKGRSIFCIFFQQQQGSSFCTFLQRSCCKFAGFFYPFQLTFPLFLHFFIWVCL